MLQHPRHNKKYLRVAQYPSYVHYILIKVTSVRKSMVRIVHYYVPYIRIRITQYSR